MATRPFPALTRCARRQKIQGKKDHIYFCHEWKLDPKIGSRGIVKGVRATRCICKHCGLMKTRTFDECGMPRAWNYQPRED